MFNIAPFNLMWFVMVILMIATIVLLTMIFKNKSEKAKTILLLSISIFNLIFWFVYKWWLSMDWPQLKALGYEFVLVKELPFHLCNISLFLVPIGLILKNNTLKSYGFYIASLGAFMALVAPSPEFVGTPFYLLPNVGFYGTHVILIIVGVLLVTLGLFKPSFKIVPRILILLLVLVLLAHGLNAILTKTTGIMTDYFYTMHDTDIGLLHAFYRVIPVRCLYLVLGLPILAFWVCITTLPFALVSKKKAKKLALNN